MSLVSFGDLAQTNLLRRHTTQAKSEIARLSQELSSGRAADTPLHVSGDLGPLLAIDASLARLAGYGSITRETGLFADAMQTGLETISNMALDAGKGLIAASGTAADSHVRTSAVAARSALQSTMSILNTRFGDRTLFAGVKSDGPAVTDADSLLTALETATSGATDIHSVEAAIDAWFAAPTGFSAMIYRGGAPLSAVPIGAGETAELDITADNPAIRATLKGLAMGALADRGTFTGLTPLRNAMVQRAGEQLLTSESDRAYLAARLGSTQAQIDTAQTRNEAEAAGLQIARVGIVDVDPYETATRLQAAEAQLQMIYTLTARISRLSLADYL